MASRSPTYRLLAGLLVTLLAVGVYSGYTIAQLRSLQRLQTGTIDRNRLDSLLLLRIQNSLNSLALAMRDMLDTDVADSQRYPLTAWQPQFRRIRTDLEDALAREENVAAAERDTGQRRYLADSFRQFWDSLDRRQVHSGQRIAPLSNHERPSVTAFRRRPECGWPQS